mmetsp:Transcript_34564/g.33766  ORF Transcript_34564/g.33766 Transcript_34564/m.33766 type:complete len:141 (+) Transcript_34564:1454-1876(+)
MLLSQDNGEYFQENGQVKNDLRVEYIKCTSWRIDPFLKGEPPEVEEQEEMKTGTRTSRDLERMNSNGTNKEEVKKSKRTTGDYNDPLLVKASLQTKEKGLYKEQVEHEIDNNAILSIDGERYPSQRIQGKVLKEALPVYF